MMQELYITKIENAKGNRRLVLVNDEPAFLLSETEVKELKLLEGMLLGEDISGRIEQILIKKALQRSLQILERRDKTEQELVKILREEYFSPRQIEAALTSLKEKNYLNDSRYAENFIRTRMKTKSRQELKNLLRQRGISDENLETAFGEIWTEDPAEETALIRHWMVKKHFDPQNADNAEKKKFMAFLIRKGFSYGDIRTVMEGIPEISDVVPTE